MITSDETITLPSGVRVRTIIEDIEGKSDTARQGILVNDGDQERKEFGVTYGDETWSLNQEELSALLQGKTLIRDINGGEYTCFLKIERSR